MTGDTHLARILLITHEAVARKYEAGQRAHGGRLWLKAGMLAHAEAEAHDLIVYLPTLRQQLSEVANMLRADKSADALALLDRILGPAEA